MKCKVALSGRPSLTVGIAARPGVAVGIAALPGVSVLFNSDVRPAPGGTHSCFGDGSWANAEPWTNASPWKNNI